MSKRSNLNLHKTTDEESNTIGQPSKRRKRRTGKEKETEVNIRPWDNNVGPIVRPTEEARQALDKDPAIVWLKEQYANGWRRYLPSLSEMPKGWPGLASDDGQRAEHLTPDYWTSYMYKGPRDHNGLLNGLVRRKPLSTDIGHHDPFESPEDAVDPGLLGLGDYPQYGDDDPQHVFDSDGDPQCDRDGDLNGDPRPMEDGGVQPSSTSSVGRREVDMVKGLEPYRRHHLTERDLASLGPERFLNDTIIDHALTELLNEVKISSLELFDQIYLFPSMFHLKLKSGKTPQDAYDKVRKWTKIDIFMKKYLIVPINESNHWYLAIIYEPEHIVNGPVDNQDHRTYIFTFDSLGGKHPRAVQRLSEYLEMEAKHKRGVGVARKVESKVASVPQQKNNYDCGLYLIHFAQAFMGDPMKYVKKITGQSKSRMRLNDLWLVDQDFEANRRKEFLGRLEGLLELQGQEHSEEDDGVVEFVETDTLMHF